jgi:hypothetical protein
MPATKPALGFGLATTRVGGPTVRPCFENIQSDGWREFGGGSENGAHILVPVWLHFAYVFDPFRTPFSDPVSTSISH